jgi:hypothetical protein
MSKVNVLRNLSSRRLEYRRARDFYTVGSQAVNT